MTVTREGVQKRYGDKRRRLEDIVELLDQSYDKMAETITPPKMTDAST